jgi:hypothetical protein
MPTRRPPRPRRGAIEDLAVAIVAIAMTAFRAGMTMNAVAMAIGDPAPANARLPGDDSCHRGGNELASGWRSHNQGFRSPLSVVLLRSRHCLIGSTRNRIDAAAVHFTSRAVAIPFSRRTIRCSSDTMVVPRGTMGCATVSLRLAERGDWRDVASNESDCGGDSVCGATDALIVADDRRDERALRRMVVDDRALTQSCNLIARSDPLSDASDPLIRPHGSQIVGAGRVANVSLNLDHKVRSAKRAIASSHLAFASPDR